MDKQEFKENYNAVRRSLVRCPGAFLSPKEGLDPTRLFKTVKFKVKLYKDNPYYFKPCGTLVFCGSQGEGKTLTAVSYLKQTLAQYPMAILVTNTRIKGRPFNAYVKYTPLSDEELKIRYKAVREERRHKYYDEVIEELSEDFYEIEAPTMTLEDYIVQRIRFYYFDETSDFDNFSFEVQYQLRDIFSDEQITPEGILNGRFKNVTVEYWGLNSLKFINNEKLGVLYFIDEIHLELNSLESKNVPVEVMVEISQQRKQRKHIVGTSQRYNRLAKPLREQVRDIVACKCYFGILQYNQLIDGDSTHEVNGELTYDVRRRMIWLHSPEMYKSYDTYAKMRRYNNEWQGRPQVLGLEVDKNE